MIAGLIGTLHTIGADFVLVNVGGVLYRVNTTSRAGEEAGGVGADIEIRTHMVVRDDAHILFGFLTEQELVWFETLIAVNGVGPRLACAVLGRFRPDDLLRVVASEEVALLSTVPGIGKRTASRILLDLRGKLPDNINAMGSTSSAVRGNPEVLAALQALGYSMAEALGALHELPEPKDDSTEEQVLAALRVLGGT